MKAIVTIKMKRDPNHDPHNKKTGVCMVSEHCTDITGQHHSYIAEGETLEEIKTIAGLVFSHITRIEVIK